MATIRPFRALRYDEAVAGPLDDLVAPPYDVIDADQRAAFLEKSPYNVVHLTLPESEEEAGAQLADWRARGVLVEEPEPALWWLRQDYEGPDGVRRRREGFVAALRVEPYENRVVLPHELTHPGPKEGRLRLLRATRTQLEPLFFLWDGSIDVDGLGEPDLQSGGDSLWRLDPEFGEGLIEALADAQLLIADGHHRYETTLAAGEEWLLAVIVPTEQEGLTIFPTHRVFESRPDPAWMGFGRKMDSPEAALAELDRLPRTGAAVAIYDGATEIAESSAEELDVHLVDRLGHEGLSYTPNWVDAVRAVDTGTAEVAVLLRSLDISQVWEVARRGDVMPQKSTFFYPKLTSGLLMLPLD